MPPKRASNKRKAEETQNDGPGPSKRARHNEGYDDELRVSAKNLYPQASNEHSQIQHNLSNNAPISSRTRSRVRKRTSTDANLETPDQRTSRPVKRKRVVCPANTERGGVDVIANEKALLLPIELHSLILDLFWEPWADDLRREILPTIRACTSVCRPWRAAALPHLFRSVRVQSSSGLHKLASVIRGDPSIASYIRKIRLYGNRERDRDRWIYAFPSIFKSPLPSLRTLELRQLHLIQPQKNDVREYVDWIYSLTTLASVCQLCLQLVRISPNALTSLVCAFPGLIKVWTEQLNTEFQKNRAPLTEELNRVNGRRMATRSLVDNRGTLSYPILHAPSSIRQVRVDDFCTEDFRFPLVTLKDWLYPDGVSPNLSMLDLAPGVEERSMAKLITAMSPSLDVLHIPTQGTDISKFKRMGLDLSKLSKLKTLRIYGWHIDYIELDTAYYFLMLLNAPQLETLCLGVYFDDTESAGFQAIDRCLATTKFSRLKEFVVEMVYHDYKPFDQRRRYIEAQFPLTRGRGIMKVRDCNIETLPFESHY